MEKLTNFEKDDFKFENWNKPQMRKESGEFQRVVSTFYNSELLEDRDLIDSLTNQYETADITDLDSKIWSVLQNTDSVVLEKDQWGELGEKMDSHGRDWKSIKDAYERDTSMEAPIIAKLPNGIFHLISGNTRLCVARVIGLIPKIVLLNFPEEYFKE
jgi:hypothetical protein